MTYPAPTKHGTTLADHRHVSPEEAEAAENTENVDVEETNHMPTESLMPTRKVLAAALTTVALYVISRFTEVDKDTEQLVNALAPLVVAYFIRNAPTPGGVPE